MALDTKSKRGSAISVGMPFRQWLAEPDGTLDAGDRASLAKLCSARAAASPGGGGGGGGNIFRTPIIQGVSYG